MSEVDRSKMAEIGAETNTPPNRDELIVQAIALAQIVAAEDQDFDEISFQDIVEHIPEGSLNSLATALESLSKYTKADVQLTPADKVELSDAIKSIARHEWELTDAKQQLLSFVRSQVQAFQLKDKVIIGDLEARIKRMDEAAISQMQAELEQLANSFQDNPEGYAEALGQVAYVSTYAGNAERKGLTAESVDNDMLREYILGKMSKASTRALERVMANNPRILEELKTVQGMLIEDIEAGRATIDNPTMLNIASRRQGKELVFLNDLDTFRQKILQARMKKMNTQPTSLEEEAGKEPNTAEVERQSWENRITIRPADPHNSKRPMIQFEFTSPRERFAFQKVAEKILKVECKAFNQIPPESGQQGSTAWELWYMPPGESPETMMQRVKEAMPAAFELYDKMHE